MKGRSRSSSIRTKRSDKSARAEWSIGSIVGELRRLGTKRNVEGMARYGIGAEKVFGVSKPKLDTLARKIGKNHAMGLELWSTGIQDAKILAEVISESGKETAGHMALWDREFADWGSCQAKRCRLFVL